jgi:condensation enzyme
MARILGQPEAAPDHSPLSYPQELWLSGDQGDEAGFFSRRFVMATALRITGRIEIAALQWALDRVVERHEVLRTVIQRDARPQVQVIKAPCAVPLRVRDLPPARGTSRDAMAKELLNEAEQSTIDPKEAPLLRAALNRFDDSDSVLTLAIHHTACDEWSVQVILRDLAACYAAEATGRPLALPAARQYREFTSWQRAAATARSTAAAHVYWQEKMRGARIFAVPTDRPVPEVHARPYSAYHFAVGGAAATRLAETVRTSTTTILLAAFNVLVHRIAGTTDQALDTLTTGRNGARFADTVGPLMNFLVFRTDIGTCASFREVTERTRDVRREAYSHEVPIQHIERSVPELMEPNEDARKTNCIFGAFEDIFSDSALQIGESSSEIYTRTGLTQIGSWIPHGVAWSVRALSSGDVSGCVQFNPEDINEGTAAEWCSLYEKILKSGAANPDRDWKAL